MLLSAHMRVDSSKKKTGAGKRATVPESLTMPAEEDECARIRLAGCRALAQLAVAWYVISVME
jgi:hypothetical protein